MTVYIDRYILINAIINFIILSITKKIIKSKSSNPRLFASSIAGALFAILMLFPQTKAVTGFWGKIIFSLILTAISFNSHTLKAFFKSLVVFYFVSFTIGGCGYAIYNIFSTKEHLDTAKLLCITVFASYMILSTVSSVYEKYFKYDSLIHSLNISVGSNHIETKCFYDTGNSLCDPISKIPVIVVDLGIAEKLLPECIVNELLNSKDAVEIYLSYCMNVKLKLIPYHTISGNGFMLGFIPTSVLVDGKEKNAIIGISIEKVANDKGYSAIVNPQII